MTIIENGTAVVMLPVAELVPGLDFRIDDDPAALAELAASIAEHGVLQPLIVRREHGEWAATPPHYARVRGRGSDAKLRGLAGAVLDGRMNADRELRAFLAQIGPT